MTLDNHRHLRIQPGHRKCSCESVCFCPELTSKCSQLDLRIISEAIDGNLAKNPVSGLDIRAGRIPNHSIHISGEASLPSPPGNFKGCQRGGGFYGYAVTFSHSKVNLVSRRIITFDPVVIIIDVHQKISCEIMLVHINQHIIHKIIKVDIAFPSLRDVNWYFRGGLEHECTI